MSVKKAVIPVAGLGTRFLPATKVVQKSLMPIVDTPIIQHNVEELVNAGIELLVLVTGKGKGAIEDHFDQHTELERKLEQDGKEELLGLLRGSNSKLRIASVRQVQPPLGFGHAILQAKDVIGNDPFVVMTEDDLVDAQTPCIKQLIDQYEKHQKAVVALMEVPMEETKRLGIGAGTQIDERTWDLNQMIEKPGPEKAPSNLAFIGRYVFPPRIFELLEQAKPGAQGEYQLTDGMHALMEEQGFIGYVFDGKRYDTGDKFGYLQATIDYALKRDDIGQQTRDYIKQLAEKL